MSVRTLGRRSCQAWSIRDVLPTPASHWTAGQHGLGRISRFVGPSPSTQLEIRRTSCCGRSRTPRDTEAPHPRLPAPRVDSLTECSYTNQLVRCTLSPRSRSRPHRSRSLLVCRAQTCIKTAASVTSPGPSHRSRNRRGARRISTSYPGESLILRLSRQAEATFSQLSMSRSMPTCSAFPVLPGTRSCCDSVRFFFAMFRGQVLQCQ